MRESFDPAAVFVIIMWAWFELNSFVRTATAEREYEAFILSSIRKQRPFEIIWSYNSTVDDALLWIVLWFCPWLHVGKRLVRQ